MKQLIFVALFISLLVGNLKAQGLGNTEKEIRLQYSCINTLNCFNSGAIFKPLPSDSNAIYVADTLEDSYIVFHFDNDRVCNVETLEPWHDATILSDAKFFNTNYIIKSDSEWVTYQHGKPVDILLVKGHFEMHFE